ncbi:hypothetical protein [Pontiella sulfatireligans]|nr:hypothetical protein [Pontiella sulfatireligans]
MDKIEWQIFGTLTFKKERMPHHHRLKMWYAEVRTLAKWQHVYFPELLWALRFEHGELTGRPHFHCLIGGLPKAAVSGATKIRRAGGSWDVVNRTCHAMYAKWARMGLKESDPKDRISQFSLYDSRLNGGAYILKCLGVDESRLSKDIYETAKFNWEADELTLSESVTRVVSAYLASQSNGKLKRMHDREQRDV